MDYTRLFALILFLCISSFVFSKYSQAQNYPLDKYIYLLDIKSNEQAQHSFDCNIRSVLDGTRDTLFTAILMKVTPYELVLEPGIHIIDIEVFGPEGVVTTKVQGLLDGKRKGSASSMKNNSTLLVGPGGLYQVK